MREYLLKVSGTDFDSGAIDFVFDCFSFGAADFGIDGFDFDVADLVTDCFNVDATDSVLAFFALKTADLVFFATLYGNSGCRGAIGRINQSVLQN